MHNPSQIQSLSQHLSPINDPRVNRTKAHSLHDILMIAILAMLCGAESFAEFERFGKAKELWLRGFLALPNGIPSHDTFGRVFAAIDNKQFAECFGNWSQDLRKALPQQIVAIDGKTLRGSHDKSNSKSAIHMVSAWGRENGLVLGQIKVEEKSNEITAIPQLLRTLQLKGCIVTIDAMGTQKQIAREMIEAGAHFVLALKGNHEKVHEEVSTFLLDAQEKDFAGTSHDFFQTVEKDHGRIEIRRYWITEDIGWFEDRDLWKGLRSVGMVESLRDMGEKTTREVRFYLSSLTANAKTFAKAVRVEWRLNKKERILGAGFSGIVLPVTVSMRDFSEFLRGWFRIGKGLGRRLTARGSRRPGR